MKTLLAYGNIFFVSCQSLHSFPPTNIISYFDSTERSNSYTIHDFRNKSSNSKYSAFEYNDEKNFKN